MKNEQLYNETVNIILDAYNNRQLKAGHPCGCFIGNIIAHRLGVKEVNDEGIPKFKSHWYEGVLSPIKYKNCDVNWIRSSLCEFPTEMASEEEGLKQIELIGYTLDEVHDLEEEFEMAAMLTKENSEEDWLTDMEANERKGNLAGMKAALIKLAEIHETKDEVSIERLERIHREVYDKDCALV